MNIWDKKMKVEKYHEFVEKGGLDEIKMHYQKDQSKLTKGAHAMIVGIASELIDRMLAHGATEDEIQLGLINLCVRIEAKKMNLDWRKWAEDNGIYDLMIEYPKKK